MWITFCVDPLLAIAPSSLSRTIFWNSWSDVFERSVFSSSSGLNPAMRRSWFLIWSLMSAFSLSFERMVWAGIPFAYFLDEISSVEDWQKGIKYLYDRGKLKGSTLLLTGSHGIDLRRAAESLARRRGDVHMLKDELPDKILLPMKFCEYAETRSEEIMMLIAGQGILKRERRHEIISQIADGKLPEELGDAFLHLKELNQLYNEYLITGGIPRAINAYVSDSAITRDIYEGHVELLLRDIRRWGGNDGLMRQIVRRLTDTMWSPVSLHNLQNETEISSHNTVTSYLDYLKDSFVLAAIYRLDQTNGSPVYRGEKKVYFEDPFIFHALRAWAT